MSAPRSTTSARSRAGRATATTLLCALLAGFVAVQPAAVATAGSTTHGAAVSRAEGAPWAAAPRILGNGEPGSLDAARYLGQFWSLVYGTSVDSFPDCFRLGPGGKVPFVPTFGAECTIREGDPVFAEGSTLAVSSLEEPFSSREAVQRRAAREFDHALLLSSLLSVDGGRPVELRTRRFEIVTGQQIVHLPENNVFGPGVEPQTITLTAHGWMATVRGLTPGLHHLTWTRVTDSGAGPEQEIRDQTIRVLARR